MAKKKLSENPIVQQLTAAKPVTRPLPQDPNNPVQKVTLGPTTSIYGQKPPEGYDTLTDEQKVGTPENPGPLEKARIAAQAPPVEPNVLSPQDQALLNKQPLVTGPAIQPVSSEPSVQPAAQTLDLTREQIQQRSNEDLAAVVRFTATPEQRQRVIEGFGKGIGITAAVATAVFTGGSAFSALPILAGGSVAATYSGLGILSTAATIIGGKEIQKVSASYGKFTGNVNNLGRFIDDVNAGGNHAANIIAYQTAKNQITAAEAEIHKENSNFIDRFLGGGQKKEELIKAFRAAEFTFDSKFYRALDSPNPNAPSASLDVQSILGAAQQ